MSISAAFSCENTKTKRSGKRSIQPFRSSTIESFRTSQHVPFAPRAPNLLHIVIKVDARLEQRRFVDVDQVISAETQFDLKLIGAGVTG